MVSSPLHSSPPPREELMFHSTNRLCVIVFELRRTPLSTATNHDNHRFSFITTSRVSIDITIALRCIAFSTSDSPHLHGVSSNKITNPNLDLILLITVQNLCLKFLRKDNSLAVLVTPLKRPHAISDHHRLTQLQKTHSPIHLASLYRNGLQFPATINETSTVKNVCIEMAAATPSIEETTRFLHWFQVETVTQLPTGKYTTPNIPTAAAGGKKTRVCLGQNWFKNGLDYGLVGHGYCFSDPNHFICPLSSGVLIMGFKSKIRQLRHLGTTYSIDLNSKYKQLRLSLIVVNGSRHSSRLLLPDNYLLRSKTVIYFRSPTLSTGFVNNVGPQSDNLVFSRALVLGSKVKLLLMALHYAELVSPLDVSIFYFIAMLIVFILTSSLSPDVTAI